eukprot:5444495-Pyramimonas_sp.AAC.1
MRLRADETMRMNVDDHVGAPLTRIAPVSLPFCFLPLCPRAPMSKAAGAAHRGVPATRAGRPEG